MKTSSLFALSFLFIAASSQAQVVFNQITTHGSGCPAGTVSTSASPDGSTLSVLFDEFRVEVPDFNAPAPSPTPGRRAPRTRPTKSMKDCQLRFTANVPVGSKVEGVEISLQARGATILDPMVSASFTAILVGYQGMSQSRGRPVPVVQKYWQANPAGVSDDWTEAPVAVVPLNSGCATHASKAITFDMKNHIEAEILNGDTSKHGIITVDSTDMSGMLKFTFRVRPCGGVR